MRSNRGGETCLELTQIFSVPQIANAGTQVTGIAQIFPQETKFLFDDTSIEQHDCAATVPHRLGPDFEITVLDNSLTFNSERVLIYRNHFFVGQDVVNFRFHIAQIVTRDQRRGKDRPQAEVSAIFFVGHAAIANLEHVGIVPVARAGKTVEPILQIEDVEHSKMVFVFALPLIAYVTRGTPKISTHSFAPEPRFSSTPFTNAQHNGAAC